VIAVRENQPKLREALADAFHKQIDQDLEDLRCGLQTTLDESPGRIDERSCCVRKIPVRSVPQESGRGTRPLASRQESLGKPMGPKPLRLDSHPEPSPVLPVVE